MSQEQRRSERDELEELAIAIGRLLMQKLPERYAIDPAEAGQAVEEAFAMWIASDSLDGSPTEWLREAACVRARASQQAREESAAAYRGTASALYRRHAGSLAAPERDALELFFGGRTYRDIAAELDVTVVYARRLVRRAVEKLRRWSRESDEK